MGRRREKWVCVVCGKRRVPKKGCACAACASILPGLGDVGDGKTAVIASTPIRVVDGELVVAGPTTIERVDPASIRFFPAGTYSPKNDDDADR